jgi:tRNA pseudouridine55 synthase
VVNVLRRHLKIKKIGHAGTLDPLATGLLILGIGRATKKLADFLHADKEYRAELTFGRTTDTYDITGKTLTSTEDFFVDKQNLVNVCQGFVGKIKQIPPMFSAKKVQGKKLYELARQGKEIVRQPKEIIIKQLEVLSCDGKKAWINVDCSSGTYVRALCQDIGQQLKVGACMSQLVRTRIADVLVAQAISLDDFEALSEEQKKAKIC